MSESDNSKSGMKGDLEPAASFEHPSHKKTNFRQKASTRYTGYSSSEENIEQRVKRTLRGRTTARDTSVRKRPARKASRRTLRSYQDSTPGLEDAESLLSNGRVSPSTSLASRVAGVPYVDAGGHTIPLYPKTGLNVFHCPFYFLDCVETFPEEDVWITHVLSHFQHHDPPSRARCPLCDFEALEEDVTRQENKESHWVRMMRHLAHHIRAGYNLASSKPDFELFSYLWKKRIISDAHYKSLRISKSERDQYEQQQPLNYSRKSAYDPAVTTNYGSHLQPRGKLFVGQTIGDSLSFSFDIIQAIVSTASTIRSSVFESLQQSNIREHGNRKRPRETNQTTSTWTNSELSISSSGTKRQRNISDNLEDEAESTQDEGSDSEGDGDAKRKGKVVPASRRRLACPFNKRKPKKYCYNDDTGPLFKSCTAGFKGMRPLKAHLYGRSRVHAAAIQCRTCGLEFTTEEARARHQQIRGQCVARDFKPCEGVNADHVNLIKQKTRGVKSEEQQWTITYKTLFPDEALVPNPFLDSTETASGSHVPEREFDIDQEIEQIRARTNAEILPVVIRRVRDLIDDRIAQMQSQAEAATARRKDGSDQGQRPDPAATQSILNCADTGDSFNFLEQTTEDLGSGIPRGRAEAFDSHTNVASNRNGSFQTLQIQQDAGLDDSEAFIENSVRAEPSPIYPWHNSEYWAAGRPGDIAEDQPYNAWEYSTHESRKAPVEALATIENFLFEDLEFGDYHR